MDAAERAQFRLDLTVFEESAAQHGAMIPLPYARNLLGQARDALDALEAAEARIAAVEALCDEARAEAEGGGMTDVDTIWPSAVIAALAAREPSAPPVT